MASKEKRTRLAFMLTSKTDYDTMNHENRLELSGYVVRIEDDGGIRNVTYGDFEHRDVWHLDDLFIRADGTPSMGERTYAWSANYRRVFEVDLARARLMAHTLGKLQSGMDRLALRWGRPTSFSAFVLHVADALKIREFVRESSRAPRKGLTYDSGEYVFMSPQSAQYWLDSEEAGFFAKNKAEAEGSEA